VFSLTVGLLLAQFVLQSSYVHSFVTALITYVLAASLPISIVPVSIFAFNLSYLAIAHSSRMYVDYLGWKLDFTGPQMLLVMKLTAFGFDYYDGVMALKKKTSSSSAAIKGSEKYAISELPSLLEFFGFVYCFPSFLAGPAVGIKEYLDVSNGSKFTYNGQLKAPSSNIMSCISKLLSGVLLLVVYISFGTYFPLHGLWDPALGLKSWYVRIGIIYFTTFTARCKYYFAWKVSEGASILSGFGFQGYDAISGKPLGWTGLSNIDFFGFELAQSVRMASRCWNQRTQSWLERYVYMRTNNSVTITYLISAVWHGFYPGYYVFFLSVPLATAVNRKAYKRVRPWFLAKSSLFSSFF
jgi:hypothetical protein